MYISVKGMYTEDDAGVRGGVYDRCDGHAQRLLLLVLLYHVGHSVLCRRSLDVDHS